MLLSDLCSLCLVFPLLSCPYLDSSCSCPHFPSAAECPRFPSALQCLLPDSAIQCLLPDSAIQCLLPNSALQCLLPDSRPGGLLSCPVSVCLEASRAPTPPPRWGVMSDLCSLCLVFPLLSCPYLVSSCSCPRFLILVN